MRGRQCKVCKCINSPDANFCVTCGQPLTREIERTMKQITTEIEEHPMYEEIKQEIARRLGEINRKV